MRNEVPGAGQPHAAGLRQRIELVLSHPGPQPDVGAPRAATRCGGTQGRNQMWGHPGPQPDGIFGGGKIDCYFSLYYFRGNKMLHRTAKNFFKNL